MNLATADAVVIVLDNYDPRQLVSANKKLHHHAAGHVRRYWRELARDAGVGTYGHADDGCAWHQRAKVTITVRWPDRRRHDVANLYSYCFKGLVDGLVDARVLPDDSDAHLVGPDPRRDPARGPHRIAITIEDMS